jgi:CheY-like chemotaxis protein
MASIDLITKEELSIEIIIEDDGMGVDPTKLEKLFLPFHRGDSKASGTGLGLSVSKSIAHQLGGDLSFKERSAGGSRFILAFTAQTIDAAATKKKESESNASLQGLDILLVEDNQTIQLLTKHLLEEAGARVELAGNGEEALEKIKENKVDLVLSDIFMPEMNGYQFVRLLREQNKSTPIIGLTAAVIGEETRLMLDAGADAVLSKPVDIAQLHALVKRLGQPDVPELQTQG